MSFVEILEILIVICQKKNWNGNAAFDRMEHFTPITLQVVTLSKTMLSLPESRELANRPLQTHFATKQMFIFIVNFAIGGTTVSSKI